MNIFTKIKIILIKNGLLKKQSLKYHEFCFVFSLKERIRNINFIDSYKIQNRVFYDYLSYELKHIRENQIKKMSPNYHYYDVTLSLILNHHLDIKNLLLIKKIMEYLMKEEKWVTEYYQKHIWLLSQKIKYKHERNPASRLKTEIDMLYDK